MGEVQIVTDVDRKMNMPSSGGMQPQVKAANEVDIGQKAGISPAPGKGLRTTVFYMLIVLIIYIGWQYRGNVYITPEEGLGYALGIIGGSMMLLLLMYPLRKHLRWTRSLGPVRHWFRAHMLMGILGPICILYHCNFQLGSTNGNIALFSMLLVAGSGLVGRYFYTKIHYGLYGKKADLSHLSSNAAMAKAFMHKAFEASPELHARLQNLEKRAVAPMHGFLSSITRVFAVAIETHWYWITSRPALRHAINHPAWCGKLTPEQRQLYYRHVKHYLNIYLGTVRQVAGLSFYERLFSLWHILHLPFFFMLVISGFVHVYAVHMY
jgi:hypothetical protein